jgi:nucleotide-binding universal stress UspA family protein
MKYFIAVDGSESSEKAYQVASKLMTKDDEVTFLTVCNKVKPNADENSASFKARLAARELLAKWEKQATDDGFTAKTLLIEAADPRDAICDAVAEHNADILVVGTRGLGTIKRMLLGSVSNYCVQHCTADVIVAK